MNRYRLPRLAFALSFVLLAGHTGAEEPEAAPTTEPEAAKVSYALGLQTGMTMKQQGIVVAVEHFSRGLADGLGDGEPEMTEAEIRQTMIAFQQQMQQKVSERLARESEANTTAGAAYLADNGKRDGVTTLDSGLQYEVLPAGEGDQKPAKTDVVQVHYTGALIDGTVFDSSVQRGQPASFPLNRVIPGWTEALQLMTVGAKWRVVIPSDLAYGERGSPPRIGPNAVLVFEVELLGINPTASQ